MPYIEVRITKVAASCPKKIREQGRIYDRETIQAENLQEAVEELDNRIPVSLDSGSTVYRGEGYETGRVYSFWKTTYDREHGKVNTWERWWTEIVQIEEETLKPDNWIEPARLAEVDNQ